MCHPYRTLHTSGPVHCNKGSHHSERPMHHNERVAPLTATRESLCTAVKTPSSQNLIFLKDHRSCITFIRHYIDLLLLWMGLPSHLVYSPYHVSARFLTEIWDRNMKNGHRKGIRVLAMSFHLSEPPSQFEQWRKWILVLRDFHLHVTFTIFATLHTNVRSLSASPHGAFVRITKRQPIFPVGTTLCQSTWLSKQLIGYTPA